jgi:hypothetical protein
LAVSDISNSLMMVMLGNGDGTFDPPSPYNTSPHPEGIIVTDFDHDGNLDIVTGTGTPSLFTKDFGSNDVSALFGDGDPEAHAFQWLPCVATRNVYRSLSGSPRNIFRSSEVSSNLHLAVLDSILL